MKPPKSKMAELAANATGGEKPHAETAESAEFKMTELGPIPVDWEVKRLGDLFELSAAGDLQSECSSRVKTNINIHPIYSNGLENAGLYGYTSKPRYRANSITITGRGTLGHAEYRTVDFDAIIRLIVMNPSEMLDGRYVVFQINYRNPFHFEITSIPQLTVPQVAQALIPIPPLAEQEKIAEALSDVDELILALGKLIEKKRNIKTGTMQELLGMRNEECGMRNMPRRRLAGFSGEWVEKRLGDCGSFSKGAGISRAQANSGRIPAVRYGELYTTHHEYIKVFESFISEDVARCSTRLTRGDIVFACSGETKEEIGKCAAFLGDEVAYAGGDLLILSPKEAYDSKFLAFELNTPFCASQKAAAGQGDAVVHIRQHSLEELIVCIPPTLTEQKAIAAVLSDMDAEIAVLEAKRAKYESIKQGMMQELLTGKTRLKGE